MVSKQAHNHWKTLENDPKVSELSKRFLIGRGNGPGELVGLTTSSQDGGTPPYCTWPLQGQEKTSLESEQGNWERRVSEIGAQILCINSA